MKEVRNELVNMGVIQVKMKSKGPALKGRDAHFAGDSASGGRIIRQPAKKWPPFGCLNKLTISSTVTFRVGMGVDLVSIHQNPI